MFGVDLLYIAYIHLTLISMGMFTCSRDSAVYISVYARRVTKYKTLKPYKACPLSRPVFMMTS